MRHAISIAAASSGTVLLALALFGEPAIYLREARSGWQSEPANEVTQSYATQPYATQPDTRTSDATPPVPADHASITEDATKARMDALQTEVMKLREALAERGQGGTGDLPDSKATDRQHDGADNATHQETANPPPTVTTPDKGHQDAPAQATPRTAPQAVAQRASPPVTTSADGDVTSAPMPAPGAVTTRPVTTPPIAATPPVAATASAATPPAAATAPVTTPPAAATAPVTTPPAAATAPVTTPPAAAAAPVTTPPAAAAAPVTTPSAAAASPVTAPPAAATAPVTTPSAAVVAPTTTPPAAAGSPVAEPRIAERAPEPPKTATPKSPDAGIAERSAPTGTAPDLSGPRIADRSESPQVAAPNPPDQRAAEHASRTDSRSNTARRTQSADRTDARDTAPRRSDAATNKPAQREAVVTPPIPPRATPPAGNPPIQAVAVPPPIASAPPRPDAARPPAPSNDQDTDAVLARLRQAMRPPPPGAPSPEPMAVAEASQVSARSAESAISPRASNNTGPVVGRLRAAHTDLITGRIEEARTQLQQAQLSLVFRPIGEEPNADALSAGAASVGKALSALGQNDVRASLGFVDRATAALLHGGTGSAQGPLPQNEVAGGYAPAYPPR